MRSVLSGAWVYLAALLGLVYCYATDCHEQYQEKVDLPLVARFAPAEIALRVGTQWTEIMRAYLHTNPVETINTGTIRYCLIQSLAHDLRTWNLIDCYKTQ